jgi:erythronate-4-phosphate dehydrogenase
MIIALDQALPYREKAFSEFGDIRSFSGRDVRPEELRDVDALIVRTITGINAPLLEGSRVRFVGSASAGFDHVDRTYLDKRKIHFFYAAGCNADAVAEYVMTALHHVAGRREWNLKRKSLAVIGVGNVGSRVAKKAGAIGMEVLLCDPPLRDRTGEARYLPLESVREADILTLHVPFEENGPYPTWHMVNRSFIDRLRPDQFIVNSSRGEVIDNRELKYALIEKRIAGVVLDVWEGEPYYDRALLASVDIGTPHVAGITLDAKIKAIDMIREDFCGFFGHRTPPSLYRDIIQGTAPVLYPDRDNTHDAIVASVLRKAYDIEKDHEDLKSSGPVIPDQNVTAFDRLRNTHPLRLEFPNHTVKLSGRQGVAATTLAGLGFNIMT